jgi:F-type H+-transporting ATPase subunit b
LEALGISINGIVAYLVNFAILLFLLQRFLYKPVKGMLEQRQTRISDALAAADRAAEEAAQQRAEFEKELATARQSSQEESRKAAEVTEKMRQDILEAARREAEDIKAKARDEAAQEKESVMADLENYTADLAMQITDKVVKKGIDESTQRTLIKEFLAELGDA